MMTKALFLVVLALAVPCLHGKSVTDKLCEDEMKYCQNETLTNTEGWEKCFVYKKSTPSCLSTDCVARIDECANDKSLEVKTKDLKQCVGLMWKKTEKGKSAFKKCLMAKQKDPKMNLNSSPCLEKEYNFLKSKACNNEVKKGVGKSSSKSSSKSKCPSLKKSVDKCSHLNLTTLIDQDLQCTMFDESSKSCITKNCIKRLIRCANGEQGGDSVRDEVKTCMAFGWKPDNKKFKKCLSMTDESKIEDLKLNDYPCTDKDVKTLMSRSKSCDKLTSSAATIKRDVMYMCVSAVLFALVAVFM